MSDDKSSDLVSAIEALTKQVEALTARVSALEATRPAAVAPAEALPSQKVPAPSVDEETLTFIAAAVAAYLGTKSRIRQVRLVREGSWSQQGRVTSQGWYSVSSRARSE